MKNWQFDVEQFRKNWDRPIEVPARQVLPEPVEVKKDRELPVDPPKRELPRKFVRVAPPVDPFPEAHGLLGRIRGFAKADLGKYETKLAPFFAETEELIARMEKASPEERKDLRAELDRVLGELEDMLALFSGIGW